MAASLQRLSRGRDRHAPSHGVACRNGCPAGSATSVRGAARYRGRHQLRAESGRRLSHAGRHRNLYVSDSFLGAIFKVAPDGSSNKIWIQDPRLMPQPGGSPPFGANGLAFDRNQGFLYVATTSDSKIYRIPLEKDGSAGPMQLFASGMAIDAAQPTTEALHGADGIMFDVRGNLYVCANSAQHPTPGLPGEIQVLSPQAQLIARYDGAGQNDLDFAASLVFHERALYITNLALDTGGA